MAETLAEPAFHIAMTDCFIVQLEGWEPSLAQFEADLSRALDATLPSAVGETSNHDGILAIRVAPRRFWLLHDGAEMPPVTVDPDLGCVLRLQEGRVGLHLAGTSLRQTLEKCVAVDWDAPTFAPGRAVQTAFHHVPVMLIRIAESECQMLVPRSFAASIVGFLEDLQLA